MFSFIMGNFIEILLSFNEINSDNEDSEDLTKWLNLMAKFNKGRPLSKEMTRQIEDYFEYYWSHDRNYAIKSSEDMAFYRELPKDIK